MTVAMSKECILFMIYLQSSTCLTLLQANLGAKTVFVNVDVNASAMCLEYYKEYFMANRRYTQSVRGMFRNLH